MIRIGHNTLPLGCFIHDNVLSKSVTEKKKKKEKMREIWG